MDEFFRVDDFLNFSNDDHLFSSNHSDQTCHIDYQVKNHYDSSSSDNIHSYSNSPFSSGNGGSIGAQSLGYDLTGQLCVPNDDVVELEWLSNFVDDSAFNDFNTTDLTGTLLSQSHTSAISSAGRSKRSRQRIWKSSISPISPSSAAAPPSNTKMSNSASDSSSSANVVRRCRHCASEKTPQWRTGPMGPKTLCNACGVRYKSGRLVPEYRPAASPTFELALHSNSHRKVMELRRQKEARTTTVNHRQGHAYRHSHDFEVC